MGLDDCSSHSGRRTLLTNASNAGINIRTIQAIARHSHLNTTARYISVTDTQIKNAVNLVSV
ncbi:MAG TPA: site-specific integrase [Gammaproteobacteria bacterium]|nr:site-specific integrase [Gammaproteobacteria bacterium]